jgi:hypothetical protein
MAAVVTKASARYQRWRAIPSAVGQLAGIAEIVDGLGDTCGERAALVQHDAELLSLLGTGGQLADDDPVGQFALHLEGCRQIQHQRIDLTVRQRSLGVVVVVEHRDGWIERFGGGVAGRADLGAELQALEPVEGFHLRRRRGLHRDDRLGDVEVGRREVDGLLSFLGDGELIEVGVERLWARRNGRVERHPHPLHVLLGISELVGDRISDRRFEALAVGGVVVDKPRWVGRLIRAEGDGPLRQRGQGVLAALFRRRWTGRRVVRGSTGGACCQTDDGQHRHET